MPRCAAICRNDEIRDGGEVGLRVGGQCHEDDIFPAALLDLPAGGDAPGVGIKNNLEQDRGIVSWCAHLVVLIPEVEGGKVYFVVDEIVERVFKGARKDLFVEADGNEFALGVVVVFVSRHISPALRGFCATLMRFDAVNIAQNDFFYSFNARVRRAPFARRTRPAR